MKATRTLVPEQQPATSASHPPPHCALGFSRPLQFRRQFGREDLARIFIINPNHQSELLFLQSTIPRDVQTPERVPHFDSKLVPTLSTLHSATTAVAGQACAMPSQSYAAAQARHTHQALTLHKVVIKRYCVAWKEHQHSGVNMAIGEIPHFTPLCQLSNSSTRVRYLSTITKLA